ncbi:ribose 5-phosphate isomerase B [Sediminitomix flava]|uniref:Ribose 5-phosphate isomerase B n=1 Tax=Sediminitomix flava TaxID=379075 RepID=A0A315ZHP5_SEDFL|nr:ribose 5-phosphate isomerase B [Sediminitomix flava]PWJ45051.1 ribose 5-phosphate isomerase B [Sediminitomix flava]
MKIAIGGDHAGYAYKEVIKAHLEAQGHEVKDFGPYSEESCDYPDYVHPLADSIEAGDNELGVIICGSGEGVSMVANKHQGIRAGLCWNSEVAALTRQHNNANVIALPARFIAVEYAVSLVDIFVSTEFEGGRHENRVNKIACK